MKKRINILAFSLLIAAALKASEPADSSKVYFEQAFSELKSMLEGKIPASFERAVFISENPYRDNRYSFESYRDAIDRHLYFVRQLFAANDRSDTMNFSAKVMSNGKFKMEDIRYLPSEKKELYLNALKNWAIFKYITDTVVVFPFIHTPFLYASDDPFGQKDWSGSQVLNLLASEEPEGNCFALAGFFKILSDRLNAGAVICTAPQHIYIQHRDKKGDMYNVELATAGHPGDGIIQTLTYSTTQSVMGGIALREYSGRESIGLCLINLAKSYEHKFRTKDDEFMLRCAELALRHDSLNLNAHLLKLQVLDMRITDYAVRNRINSIARLKAGKEIAGTYHRLQKQLQKLYALGYRQMPLYMQQMILDGFSGENTGSTLAEKNPSPYTTIKPKDAKDGQYATLSHGVFQEVFVPQRYEAYGHFTFDTKTKTITSFDSTGLSNFLIDPVAFAYNFGARMYNAQTGTFVSMDPAAHKFAGWSPYTGLADNPVFFIDPDGRIIRIHYQDANGANKYYDYKPGEMTTIDNDYVQNTVTALNHLRQHDEGFGNSAKNMIDMLSYTRYCVIDLRDTKGIPTISTDSNKQADVNWNPNTGILLVDDSGNPTGGTQSPATTLMHELDHVKDAFESITQFTADSKNSTGDYYQNVADRRTIQGIETSVAAYFGEGTRTNYYYSSTFYTNNPTSAQETLIDNSSVQGQEIDINTQQNSYLWE